MKDELPIYPGELFLEYHIVLFIQHNMDHHIVWMKENVVKEPVTLRVVAYGHIASILRSEPIPIGSNGSSMVIEYRLYSKEDSLRVSYSVDWKESHKKVCSQLTGATAHLGKQGYRPRRTLGV